MITNLISRDEVDQEVIYPSAWRSLELKFSPLRMGRADVGVRILGLVREQRNRRAP